MLKPTLQLKLGQSLRDHWLWQLEREDFSPRETLIGEALIDSINDDGYLTAAPQDITDFIAAEASVSIEGIEQALSKVQRLDPVGIGARSPSECIVLQLHQLESATPGIELAISMATDYLPSIAAKEYGEIRRALHTSEEDFEVALALVKSCHPKPGLALRDKKIAELLADVGITVARRTVAKYREALNITSSSEPKVRKPKLRMSVWSNRRNRAGINEKRRNNKYPVLI